MKLSSMYVQYLVVVDETIGDTPMTTMTTMAMQYDDAKHSRH